jgi:RNA polymerase sigma-70 factor, ECF subfamily
MCHADESQWVLRAQTGDRQAFAHLVDYYWERLCRWLFALTSGKDLAEDITQETFLRAWSALPRLQSTVSFRIWLFRIARNCLLAKVRSLRNRKLVPLPPDVACSPHSPLDDMVDDESQQMLRDALVRVPVGYRMAYLLWTQEDLPYCTIAQVLGVSEETARWRVCKARQFLRRELKVYLDLER